jgi:O-antigen/teichoic acid export membrane protein
MITSVCVALFCALTFVAPEPISFICAGSPRRANLVYCLLPMVYGFVLSACTSSYCLGRMWIGPANVIQLVTVGIIPVAALGCFDDIEHFLSYAGFGLCALNGVVIMALYWLEPSVSAREHAAAAVALFRYGVRRVPGDLAYYGLLAAPAIAVAYYGGVQAGGEVAYGMVWVTLIGQLVAPLSMLMLPEASYLFQCGKAEAMRRRLVNLLGYSFAVTCGVVAVLSFAAPALIEAHLGACTPSLLHHVRILLVAAIPLNVFICLRSIVDAGTSRAVSPTICVAALLTFGCLFLLALNRHHSPGVAVYAFIVAVGVLSVASAAATWFIFQKYDAVAREQAKSLVPIRVES